MVRIASSSATGCLGEFGFHAPPSTMASERGSEEGLVHNLKQNVAGLKELITVVDAELQQLVTNLSPTCLRSIIYAILMLEERAPASCAELEQKTSDLLDSEDPIIRHVLAATTQTIESRIDAMAGQLNSAIQDIMSKTNAVMKNRDGLEAHLIDTAKILVGAVTRQVDVWESVLSAQQGQASDPPASNYIDTGNMQQGTDRRRSLQALDRTRGHEERAEAIWCYSLTVEHEESANTAGVGHEAPTDAVQDAYTTQYGLVYSPRVLTLLNRLAIVHSGEYPHQSPRLLRHVSRADAMDSAASESSETEMAPDTVTGE